MTKQSHNGVAGLLEALAQPDENADPDALLGDAAVAGELSGAAVSGFVAKVWAEITAAPAAASRSLLSALARRAGSVDGLSRELHGALEYLDLWAAVVSYMDDHELRWVTWHDLAQSSHHVEALIDTIGRREPQLGTRYGALMLRAMLVSLSDREAAAALFREAGRDSPGLAATVHIDAPAHTYLTSAEVAAASAAIADRRATFLEGFELLIDPAADADADELLVFSCDPLYFAAFFPYWATAAQYLAAGGIAMHFVIVGDRGEADACVERALAVSREIARLRGFAPASVGSCLSFSTATVPGYVAQEQTLYACARYLLAREIASRVCSRVLVLDIDMQMRREPPAMAAGSQRTADGGLPLALNLIPRALIPARRILAGIFSLPDGERGEGYMEQLESYTYSALERQTSWTLDQNALTYATEQLVAREGPTAIAHLGAERAAFFQPPVRTLYKNGQRRQQRQLGMQPS